MAEEFINQGGVCSGNWWNPTRNALFGGGLTPCSGAAAGDLAGFGWPVESSFAGLTASANSDLTQTTFMFAGGGASSGSGGIRISNPSCISIMNESGSSDSSTQIQNDWSPGMTGDFAGKAADDHRDSSPMIGAFKDQINYANHVDISSSSCGYPSNMIKSAFLLDQPAPLFENLLDYSSQMVVPSYSSSCSDDSSSATFGKLPSLPLLKPMISSCGPNPNSPHQPAGRLKFSNNTPHWNASMAALDDIRASLLGSLHTTSLSGSSIDEKPIRSNSTKKANSQYSQARRTAVKKASPEPAVRRARIETPSPLPTFKVRKEKLGDRITALQQLVSPFGKTDTASVLHEAIEYIKFLHDHVNTLSMPYMKSESSYQHQQGFTGKSVKPAEGQYQMNLRSRGLCLVPMSSTFAIANEISSDFWTPTFGGSFR
ncbi:hypothetical protein SAY87_022049 [Trapa incisa]|uniref:BHLH domain-containing protein n=1 Tax=Trapa incisa TaxID=236973 RepID=A0AAN7JTA5_9MYRT|nr:hypothetical protein SAY87_022049 [Trapa incisa]